MSDFIDDWCRHPEASISRPRRRVLRNGTVTFWRQCTICGAAIAPAATRAVAMRWAKGHPADFDETLKQIYAETRKADLAAARVARRKEWFSWYDQYLLSDEWRRLRALVFDRCGGLCEGCRSAPAEQVHHRSYEHAGNEFLFELVALCVDCHRRIHDDTPNQIVI